MLLYGAPTHERLNFQVNRDIYNVKSVQMMQSQADSALLAK